MSSRPSDARREGKSADILRDRSVRDKSRGIRAEGTASGINISVYVRIRPNVAGQSSIDLSYDNRSIRIDEDSSSTPNNTRKSYIKSAYTFDRVFGPKETNEEIYSGSIEQEVAGALEGINTSILLYGVTGSGKTHTVFGNLGYRDNGNNNSENGIIYYCFDKVSREENTTVELSYLEIYNEQVKDLLGDEDNLLVQESATGDVIVQGLSSRQISCFEEMIAFIKEGNQRRKMAVTGANAFSSRSHAILQLNIRKQTGNIIAVSKLSFVDLAGSERVELTQNKGLRLHEGSNINKSLLALGKVINRLADSNSAPDSYVPYRDSKLTRLLKDSLGGNTKTILIACISPHKLQSDETIHSLNYAARAKRIKLMVTANTVEEIPPMASLSLSQITQQPQFGGVSVPPTFLQEIEQLKGQIGQLEKELQRERTGKEGIEQSYNSLISELQIQWELKNSLAEIEENLQGNRQKLMVKRNELISKDITDIAYKKLLLDEIHQYEESIADHEELQKEILQRLHELEKKRAEKLGLLDSNPHKETIDKIDLEKTKQKTKEKHVFVERMAEREKDESLFQLIEDKSDSLYEESIDVRKTLQFSSDPVSSNSPFRKLLSSGTNLLAPVNISINSEQLNNTNTRESQVDYDNFRQEFQLFNPLNPFEVSREEKIQLKLQKARERMREFKKKLSLMKIFLQKYEDRAIQKGSADIYKAVSALLKEQLKHKYLLSEEENEILENMKTFSTRYRQQNPPSPPKPVFEEETFKENQRTDPNKIRPNVILGYTNPKENTIQVANSSNFEKGIKIRTEERTDKHALQKSSNSGIGGQLQQLNKTEAVMSKINRLLN